MSAPLPSPLSEHTVHVPPRQTCHVRAQHPSEATQIALTDCQWGGEWGRDQDAHPDPRASLHFSASYGSRVKGSLSLADNHITIEPTRDIILAVGNYADETLIVTFEIRGDS